MRQDDAGSCTLFYLLHHSTISSAKGIRKLAAGFESVSFDVGREKEEPEDQKTGKMRCHKKTGSDSSRIVRCNE